MSHFFCVLPPRVLVGHGDFSLGGSFIFSPNQLLGEVLSSELRNPRSMKIRGSVVS